MNGKSNREARAVAGYACPTCQVRPGQPCVDRDGVPLRSVHGPGCHPLRRKLVQPIRIDTGEANAR